MGILNPGLTATGAVTSFSADGTGLTPATATTGAVTLGGTLSVGNGGTGTGTTFTQGSVVFAGTSGVYSQNNPNLFWDNANSRLGIGTNTPATALDVVGQIRAMGGTVDVRLLPVNVSGAAIIGTFSASDLVLAAGSGGPERVRILTSNGNVGIGTSAPGSPLDVVGNINASYISTSSSTSTTPTLSFNASNTSVAKGATVAGSYVQDVNQNKSATAGASANYVVSPDNGTDSTYYGEFGINSSVFSASTPADFFSLNNQIYFSGHDGDIAIGSGNGYKTYFPWGATAASAHVINASGALGFSTNLGTTLANSGTIGFGTSGQALITAGSGAAPAWGNVASPYSAAPLFGTGADGAVTISSGTTTLTRDMHYSSLTLSGSGAINSSGYRIYVKGTLDISAAASSSIYANGGAGGNATGATPPAYNGTAGNAGPATAGSSLISLGQSGTGNTTTGTNPTIAISTVGFGTSAKGGTGGSGGAGVSAGGTGLAGQLINSSGVAFNSIPPQLFVMNSYNTQACVTLVTTSLYGGPAGQGGGDGVNAGGGGGGPGGIAGGVQIYASTLATGTNTNTAIIQAKGGAGGNGGNAGGGNAGGGGGGGGSSGGLIYIVYGSRTGSTITNALDVSGGAGGVGGTGSGTGRGGSGGAGGGVGAVFIFNLSASTNTASQPGTNGSAGGTTVTTTGGTSGAGGTLQVNL